MSLKNTAQETLNILKAGKYTNSAGKTVEFLAAQQMAVKKTVLYTPQQSSALLEQPPAGTSERQPTIEVTSETTQVAAQRLVRSEGCNDLVLLSFASARNPGGGFINGAKAQEEDLARCSGIYPCLLTQPAYYDANRQGESLLYTDNVIYSPNVPWIRVRNRELIDDVFLASVITAPAPNAGQALRRDPNCGDEIEITLRRRAGIVLAIARDNGHLSLLLGAWGCGVFSNDPNLVADAFGQWLTDSRFVGCFDRVVFAIYTSKSNVDTLTAFQQRFSS
ncbi:TIGR02452 family protein [Chamaesiphon polymorphus]|uniref:TIGR02452 family protein n=1 Tax=Chamaesiphon polymorphus CCALA 037 TaxID=2107692 RepID=A0A2T1GAH3_9CYAN|nr:TIGR02452 family protein [Chamaesiphon polymorphus]PSB54235.1 TIGR02452 family protein [Chamaesiphon polymorphus CCALA 037]